MRRLGKEGDTGKPLTPALPVNRLHFVIRGRRTSATDEDDLQDRIAALSSSSSSSSSSVDGDEQHTLNLPNRRPAANTPTNTGPTCVHPPTAAGWHNYRPVPILAVGRHWDHRDAEGDGRFSRKCLVPPCSRRKGKTAAEFRARQNSRHHPPTGLRVPYRSPDNQLAA